MTFQADEAYCIGPAPSAESYVSTMPLLITLEIDNDGQLRMDNIIDICHRSGAQVSASRLRNGVILTLIISIDRQYIQGKAATMDMTFFS